MQNSFVCFRFIHFPWTHTTELNKPNQCNPSLIWPTVTFRATGAVSRWPLTSNRTVGRNPAKAEMIRLKGEDNLRLFTTDGFVIPVPACAEVLFLSPHDLLQSAHIGPGKERGRRICIKKTLGCMIAAYMTDFQATGCSIRQVIKQMFWQIALNSWLNKVKMTF